MGSPPPTRFYLVGQLTKRLEAKMSHYAPPPAEGMGSNRSNTIRLIPCILKSSVSIYLIHHQLILAQLEEWEGDLQNALHSQMSERIESSSRNVFFKFIFRFSDSLFSLIFSLLQEVERWREKQRRRGQKAFQDSLIFLTLRILKKKSQRIYFLVLAYS